MNAEEVVMAVIELIARGGKLGMPIDIYDESTTIRVYPYDDTPLPEDDES